MMDLLSSMGIFNFQEFMILADYEDNMLDMYVRRSDVHDLHYWTHYKILRVGEDDPERFREATAEDCVFVGIKFYPAAAR